MKAVWLGRQSPQQMWEKEEFKAVLPESIVGDLGKAHGLNWICQ